MEVMEKRQLKISNKQLEQEFIKKINEVYEKCTSYETYGNITEFYDEDGITIMTATEDENKIIFQFGDFSDVNYEYSTIEE